jgi:hypothetical protein
MPMKAIFCMAFSDVLVVAETLVNDVFVRSLRMGIFRKFIYPSLLEEPGFLLLFRKEVAGVDAFGSAPFIVLHLPQILKGIIFFFMNLLAVKRLNRMSIDIILGKHVFFLLGLIMRRLLIIKNAYFNKER